MEGVQDRLSSTESAQVSGGYDGPGPCGVSPPHHARLGGQSCLRANEAGCVHSTSSTRAASERAQTGMGRVSDSPGQPSADADGTLDHPRLSITVTLPACRTATEGRGPPFPVIIFINGFQVGLDFHQGCTLDPRARDCVSGQHSNQQAMLTNTDHALSCAPASTPSTRSAWRAGDMPSSNTTRACSASLMTAPRWMPFLANPACARRSYTCTSSNTCSLTFKRSGPVRDITAGMFTWKSKCLRSCNCSAVRTANKTAGTFCRTQVVDVSHACACTQLRYLDSVLDWLAAENARPGGFAQSLLDLRTIGVAGHSRGAKLAALHLVGEPSHSQRAYHHRNSLTAVADDHLLSMYCPKLAPW